jgi:hypothetical protein
LSIKGLFFKTKMNAPDIYLNPTFIDTPDVLFEWLNTSVAWDERMKARKTASFGVAYDYSQITYDPVPMPARLEDLCGRVQGGPARPV